jgi:hypothetical protein
MKGGQFGAKPDVGADIIFFNWGLKWMSHPVLVFDFGGGTLDITVMRLGDGLPRVLATVRSIRRKRWSSFRTPSARASPTSCRATPRVSPTPSSTR